jgi:hypothetical protein
LWEFWWKLWALRVVAFSRIFRRFFALFGIVQRHNQNVKSLMQLLVGLKSSPLSGVSRVSGYSCLHNWWQSPQKRNNSKHLIRPLAEVISRSFLNGFPWLWVRSNDRKRSNCGISKFFLDRISGHLISTPECLSHCSFNSRPICLISGAIESLEQGNIVPGIKMCHIIFELLPSAIHCCIYKFTQGKVIFASKHFLFCRGRMPEHCLSDRPKYETIGSDLIECQPVHVGGLV